MKTAHHISFVTTFLVIISALDNPGIGGVQSHIFSYGHRNPQGTTTMIQLVAMPGSVVPMLPRLALHFTKVKPFLLGISLCWSLV